MADRGGLLEFSRIVVEKAEGVVTSCNDIEEDLLEMGEVHGDWLGGVYGIRSTTVWTFLVERGYGTSSWRGVGIYVVGAREIRREVSSRRNDHRQEKGRPFFKAEKKIGIRKTREQEY